MNDFGSDFEHELHASRPVPRGELLDSLVSKSSARPATVRRGKWQLRLAGVLAAASLLGLAGLGGVSVAANAINGGGSQVAAASAEKKETPVCTTSGNQLIYVTKAEAKAGMGTIYYEPTPGNPPTCTAP